MATKKKAPAALLTQWKTFVESVEKGYPFGLYDYRNDLDVRSLLASAGPSPQVAELDQRFQAALTARKIRIWESDAPDAFWCFGYPRKTNAEFKQDLKAEGLI